MASLYGDLVNSILSVVDKSIAIAEAEPEKAEESIMFIETTIDMLTSACETAATPEIAVFKDAILQAEAAISTISILAADATAKTLTDEDAVVTSSAIAAASSSSTSDTDVDAANISTGAPDTEAPSTAVASGTNPDTSSAVRKSSELYQDEEHQAKRRCMMATAAKDTKANLRRVASFSKNSLKTLEKLCDFPCAYVKMKSFDLALPSHHSVNLKSVFYEVKRTIKFSAQEVHEMLEIPRYSLITPVLNALAEVAGVEHWGQYSLRDGTHAQGSTDWALIYKGLPVFIIEGKQNIDNNGVAQLVLQMYEAYMKLGQRGTKDDPWVMYGMVTTAINVAFIRALFCEEYLIEIKRNKNVFSIPHNKDTEVNDYINGMSPVAMHMEAMLAEQKTQVDKALDAPTKQQQQ